MKLVLTLTMGWHKPGWTPPALSHVFDRTRQVLKEEFPDADIEIGLVCADASTEGDGDIEFKFEVTGARFL